MNQLSMPKPDRVLGDLWIALDLRSTGESPRCGRTRLLARVDAGRISQIADVLDDWAIQIRNLEKAGNALAIDEGQALRNS